MKVINNKEQSILAQAAEQQKLLTSYGNLTSPVAYNQGSISAIYEICIGGRLRDGFRGHERPR